MSQEVYDLNWHTYSDHLQELMKHLMQSNESADVTLVCDDKTKFKAHKFVLNACNVDQLLKDEKEWLSSLQAVERKRNLFCEILEAEGNSTAPFTKC